MNDPPSTTGPPRALTVVCSDEQVEVAVDVARHERLAAAVLADVLERAGERDAGGELTLTFVDRAEISELNAEHMAADGPTDVLSFPMDTRAPPLTLDRLLGDVVICPGVAAEQAPDHAGSVDDELALLVVHGILHVLGHDHADDATSAAMRAEERRLLATHHWPAGTVPAAFRQEHLVR